LNTYIASAPAKINWTLDIVGVDEKGYHLVDMLMARIALYDAVTVSPREEGITLNSNLFWLPKDERNTAMKAARLFFEKTGASGGVDIFIKKNIPSGAGLAGGSADGAAVLTVLNTMYGNLLSSEELDEIALAVGADVPYMMRSGLYRATGIGEKLTKLEGGNTYTLLLVMNKRESASTKAVYGLYDSLGSSNRPDNGRFYEALQSKSFALMNSAGGNVLERASSSIAGGIGTNLKKMREAGAEFVSMTGSGAVVYGVFNSPDEAATAQKLFPNAWSAVCNTVENGITVRELKK